MSHRDKEIASRVALFDQQEMLLLEMVDKMPSAVQDQILHWGQGLQLSEDVRQIAAGQLLVYGLAKARVILREREDDAVG